MIKSIARLLNSLKQYNQEGLFFVRLIIGLTFILIHGWEKIAGGESTWVWLGNVIVHATGLSFPPAVFWGLMSTAVEFLGGFALLTGFMFRPACFMLIGNMIVAACSHFLGGESWGEASQAIELTSVFVCLFLVGPGKYSLDSLFFGDSIDQSSAK